jgi:regulator of replication initiation timing
MGRESRKQIKAQVTNEVRNKYFKIIEGKNEEISQLVQRCLKIQRQNEELVTENIKLKEQFEMYEDWNRRLQEFMDMDPDSREEVITQYHTSKELNDRFSNILNMYEKMFGMF